MKMIGNIMASKIRDIPKIKGKDAERFNKINKENENKKVPVEEYNRAMETYEKIIRRSDIG